MIPSHRIGSRFKLDCFRVIVDLAAGFRLRAIVFSRLGGCPETLMSAARQRLTLEGRNTDAQRAAAGKNP
jgi:hypothetical protein